MRHVYWVIPNKLAGRAGPDEVPWDLKELCGNGFRAILSLNDNVDALEIQRLGFAHMLAPLSPNFPPSRHEIEEYKKLVPKAIAFLEECLGKGMPTLVHCHAGKDRTGIVLAVYMILKKNMGAKEAVNFVKACRRR